jgi:hypothetical protein
MTLKCRNAALGDKIFNMSNLMPVTEFKQMYINGLEDPAINDIANIRMFAMGKELKDDLFIFSYDIINESTVQVMIKK